MENLKFVSSHDPILHTRCRALTLDELKSTELQALFDAMINFAKGEQGNIQKHVLVGLAAPQIGKAIRVILADVKADGQGNVAELRLYINPEIIDRSQETREWYEGCYSTGNVKGVVRRPHSVTIHALNRDGARICETHAGYVARIFQHEIDHLDGIRFLERMDLQQDIHVVKADEMPVDRTEQGWKN